jgi:hypothetical protein
MNIRRTSVILLAFVTLIVPRAADQKPGTEIPLYSEGVDIAHRLNEMGIDAFVLKYRLVYSGPDAPKTPPNTNTAPGDRLVIKGAFKAQTGQDLVGLAIDDGRAAVQLVRERAANLASSPIASA